MPTGFSSIKKGTGWKSTLQVMGVGIAYMVGLMLTARSLTYLVGHVLLGWLPSGGLRLEICLAVGLVLLAGLAAASEGPRLGVLGRLIAYCCVMACAYVAIAVAGLWFQRAPHALQEREWAVGLVCASVVVVVLLFFRRQRPRRKRQAHAHAVPGTPVAPPGAAISYRRIGVAKSTYFVLGILAAIFVVPGVLAVMQGEDEWLGVFLVALGVTGYWHFCFQAVELVDGLMVISRPFAPTRRVPLAEVTEVRTAWSGSFRGRARRFEFISGDATLGTFNPKLYSLEDLACILNEVRVVAPGAFIDRDTASFLPHEAKRRG